MPIKADTIMGFRARTKVIVMEILDEIGLIKPPKKDKPKPPPDPEKIIKAAPKKAPAKKAVVKKAVSILLVFGLASLMFSGSSFALLRPRNMDEVTTETWTFQSVLIPSALVVTGTTSMTAPALTGAVTVGDATAVVTFNSGTYGVTNSDDDITNVGDIAVDTISADDGSSFAISDDFTNAGNTIADLGIVTTADINAGTFDGVVGGTTPAAGDFTSLGATGVTSTGGVDLGTSQALTGTTGLTIGAGAETVAIDSSDWDIDATGIMSGIGTVGCGAITTSGLLTLSNSETIDNATNGIVNIIGDGLQVQGALNYAGTSTSTGPDTYVLDATPNLVVTSPLVGQMITWSADTTGTGASTISVDGVSDTLMDREGNATASGDVTTGMPTVMIFGSDGNWHLVGI